MPPPGPGRTVDVLARHCVVWAARRWDAACSSVRRGRGVKGNRRAEGGAIGFGCCLPFHGAGNAPRASVRSSQPRSFQVL